MIRLFNQDDAERARAVLAISRTCRDLRGRMIVFAPAAQCGRLRDELRGFDEAALASIRLLSLSTSEQSQEPWAGVREEVLAAIREHAGPSGPLVVWVEVPQADEGLASEEVAQAQNLTALGMMAAGIAHELANPLSIISSSLQYLHQRLAAQNDSTSEFTMAALQNVDRMHGLLRNMLNYAAVRGPNLQEADLNQVIAEAVGFMSAEFERKGIDVELSMDPGLRRIRMDAGRIKQIILNLLRNALDEMSGEGALIRVTTRVSTEGTQAEIDVENNGPPIPDDVLANLFRPFYTSKDGGNGLGLYLSRQNAKEHGGNIVAENLPHGVRFTVTLSLYL